VVVITTDKVYENKEWDYPYRENDELGGYDIYSSSKACAEILVNSFTRSFFGEPKSALVATARAGNVIGGGDWSADRLLPDLVKAASVNGRTEIRNPESVRPWQHVLDCLSGYLLLGEKLLKGEKDFAGSWNFSPNSDDSKTVKEVVALANSVWEEIEIIIKRSDLEFHEAKTLKLDNSKARVNLGWRPVWDTKVAVEKTVKWYKAFYSSGQVLTSRQIQDYFSANEIH
jgi:CDP-glucose 4,6-dehydratase